MQAEGPRAPRWTQSVQATSMQWRARCTLALGLSAEGSWGESETDRQTSDRYHRGLWGWPRKGVAKALSSLLLCSSVSPKHTRFLCSREAAATPVELRSGRTVGNLLPFPLPTCVPLPEALAGGASPGSSCSVWPHPPAGRQTRPYRRQDSRDSFSAPDEPFDS